MGTSGWTNEDNEITIPADAAGTDRPRIVITGTAPDGGYPLDAAILFYWNRTDYWFIGVTRFEPTWGAFVRGFEAPSVGQGDHFEEIAYSSVSGVVDSERFIGNQGASGHVIELISDGEYRLSVSGTIERAAQVDYKITQGVTELSEPRGTLDIAQAVATGGITTTETVVETLTQNAGDLSSQRRYNVAFIGRVLSTVAADRVKFRIRRQSVTGTVVADFGELLINAANVGQPVNCWSVIQGAGVLNEQFVLTAQRITGTGTITYSPISAILGDVAPSSLT